MHGLTRMATARLGPARRLPSTWYSSEVITLAWPCTHLKAGNHTTTLQYFKDGWVRDLQEWANHDPSLQYL